MIGPSRQGIATLSSKGRSERTMTRLKSSLLVRTGRIDETRRLVDAIAREMWVLYGWKGTLNWNGVERHLQELAARTRRQVWTVSEHLAR